MNLDASHDPALRSWVASANGHADFPIQNLPVGLFSIGAEVPRAGVAIGDMILDLSAPQILEMLGGGAADALPKTGGRLNDFMALGATARQALRHRLVELLREGAAERPILEGCLHHAGDCRLHVPAEIGDYTDFYTGIHHARNVGALFRPDNPLLPNYEWVPIGYHGRASSVVPSGTAVRRPSGQVKAPDEDPRFQPTGRLDYEVEIGIWVGPGNPLGTPIDVRDAQDHVAGYCLLNDWSARDIQAWEYQPLGPFLAKNFATTISPWVVTPEALVPFRIGQPARPSGAPEPLSYLLDEADQAQGAIDLEITVAIRTSGMAAQGLPAHTVAVTNMKHMYWTVAQIIAHHTSGGCNMRPGDLIGTGTISGLDRSSVGSLLEVTQGGRDPLQLPGGEARLFLEDGDEVIMTARAVRKGFASIGFGSCHAVIVSGNLPGETD
jgi:fumarylacetoacetase